MSSSKNLLSDIFVSAIPKILAKSKGIFFIPIITKVISQDAYGVWTNFTIAVTLFASIASLSLGASANKYLVNSEKNEISRKYSAMISITSVSSVVIGSILIAFQDPVASFVFGRSYPQKLIFFLVTAIFLNQFTNISTQLLRSQRQISMYSIVKSIRSIGEIGTIGLTAVWFGSIESILISFILFNMLLSISIFIYISSIFGVGIPDFSHIGEYLQFSVPLIISGTMYWFVNVSDRYLITYFHSVDVTGGYAVVYATASGLSIFSMAIGTVLFPDLSALRANNDIEEYRRRLSNVLKYYFIITIPAAVGLIVIADPLLRLLSTASISEYTDLMLVLAPAMVAYGLVNILIQALLSDGRSRVSALIWGTIAVLNLGANVILVPRYAAMGASVTTLGSFVVGLVVVVLWKRTDITLSLVVLGKVPIASVTMGGAVAFVRSLVPISDIVALPVLIGTGIFVYGVLGFASGFLTRRDIEFVLDAI